MKKIFTLADRFRCKLADEQPPKTDPTSELEPEPESIEPSPDTERGVSDAWKEEVLKNLNPLPISIDAFMYAKMAIELMMQHDVGGTLVIPSEHLPAFAEARNVLFQAAQRYGQGDDLVRIVSPKKE